tara:strand:- start:108 stop:719 length:612 start_codon:yes stop_codon:yes gene_type:complete
MSFVAVVGGAIAVGSAIYGGVQGMKRSEAADEARGGVWDIYSKNMNLLKDQTALNKRSTEAAFTQTQRGAGDALAGADVSRQYGGQALGQGTSSAIGGVMDFSQQNVSGMATSGTQKKMVGEGMSDIMNKYQTDMNKLVDTRGLAQRGFETTMAGARTQKSLALQQGKLDWESGYQDLQQQREGMLSDVESEDVGFLGGFFGA